jgi:uncharacterized membrane-anchored protein YhcB (DUF1043 family)
MVYLLIVLLIVVVGINGYLLYKLKDNKETKEEINNKLDRQEKEMKQHFDALMNYSADTAYKRSDIDV